MWRRSERQPSSAARAWAPEPNAAFVYPTGNVCFDDGWTLRYRVVQLDGPELTTVVSGMSHAAVTTMAALTDPVVAFLEIGADQ